MSTRIITYKIVFCRNGNLNKNGEGAVQIEAYKDGKSVYFTTGIKVKPENWDNNKRSIIKRPDRHTLNNRITHIIEQYKELEHSKSRNNPEFTVSDLKQAIKQLETATFTEFALAHIDKEKGVTQQTQNRYKGIINVFIEFAGGHVSFANITKQLADDFNQYLISNNIAGNTRKSYFKYLSKYTIIAIEYGYIESRINPFGKVEIRAEKVDRDALDESELSKIEKLQFTEKQYKLAIVRDMFLFTCYTGLRFSDVCRVSNEHIAELNEGLALRMISEKEKKKIDLPLWLLFPTQDQKYTRPEQLVKHYWNDKGHPFFLALRSKTKEANNQYCNRLLKEIQELAGIRTKLTNHVGRHTFATFLISRAPLPVVKELLQHSNINTTMMYIHVTNDKVKEHLKKITDWF